MNNITLLIIGTILGYIFFETFCSDTENNKNKIGISLQIYYRNQECFHVHHWVILSVLLVCVSFIKNIKYRFFLSGVCFGGMLQGLKYRDRFIFCKRCTEQFKENKNR